MNQNRIQEHAIKQKQLEEQFKNQKPLMSSPSTIRPSSGQSKPKDLTSTLMEKNMINMARPSMNQMRPGKQLLTPMLSGFEI